MLTAAVEGLDPDAVGASLDDLAELCALVSRLQARMVEAVGVCDVNGIWALDDATSMTAWLKGFGALSAATGHSVVLLARRLRQLPGVAAALTDGTLSYDQVRAMMANVEPALMDQFVEHEAYLVDAVAGLSVADVATAMRHWRVRARARLDDPAAHEPRRSLHTSRLADGALRLDGELPSADGDIVAKALTLAASPDAAGEPPRTASERRADALVDLARWFLDHRAKPPATRRRPHVDYVVPVDGHVGSDADGSVVDPVTLEHLLCDAAISRLLVQGRSHILDYGIETRVIPAPLFRALVRRDRHCRWPGCDRTADWCEGHHVRHWTKNGPTHLDNLVLLCCRHHHRLHDPGWTVTLDPADATLTIVTADGRVLSSRPPPLVERPLHDTG